MQPVENQIVSDLVATIEIPRSGSRAKRLPDSLDQINSDRCHQLFQLLSQYLEPANDVKDLKAQVKFINAIQDRISTQIAQLGAPPITPYTETSAALANLQNAISFAIETIASSSNHKESKVIGPSIESIFESLRFLIHKNLDNQSLREQITNTSYEETSNSTLLLHDTSITFQPSQNSTTTSSRRKNFNTAPTRRHLNVRPILRSVLGIGLVFLCSHPHIFNLSKQWDGGLKNKIARFEAKQIPTISLDDKYISPNNIISDKYTKPLIPKNISSNERIKIENNPSNSPSRRNYASDLLLAAFAYYLMMRYIFRPIAERFQGVLRPRHEGFHRQIRIPFRGQPKKALAGCINTEDPNLLKRLWITSIWDPVSVKSIYRIDRNSFSVEIKKRGARASALNYFFANRNSPQIRPPHKSLPHISDGLINRTIRAPSYLRFLFPHNFTVEHHTVWQRIDNPPSMHAVGSRQNSEADVSFPIPKLRAGKLVSLPVVFGYQISAIDLPKNASLWKSENGTWQLKVPFLYQGTINYRISKGACPKFSDQQQPYLQHPETVVTHSSEVDLFLLNSQDKDSSKDAVENIAELMRSNGAQLSYTPISEHAVRVSASLAASLFDAFPMHSHESLNYVLTHKARALGYSTALASGFRIDQSNQRNAFLVSEWSNSVVASDKTSGNSDNLVEVDVIPNFGNADKTRPQFFIKDLFLGVEAFFAPMIGIEAQAKEWSERFYGKIEDSHQSDKFFLIRSLFKRVEHASLEAKHLMSKLSLLRAASSEIESGANRLGIDSSKLTNAKILIEQYCANLISEIKDKVESANSTNWWSKAPTPQKAFSLLVEASQQVNFSDDTSLFSPLTKAQAAEFFFQTPAFTSCFESQAGKYTMQLCGFLDALDGASLAATYSQQNYFVEHLAVLMSDQRIPSKLRRSFQSGISKNQLCSEVLEPYFSWLLKSCSAQLTTPKKAAEDLTNFCKALRVQFGPINRKAWLHTIVETLFVPKSHPIGYGIPEVWRQVMHHLNDHELFGNVIDNGAPSTKAIKLLDSFVYSGTCTRNYDFSSYQIKRAQKALECLVFLNQDLGQIESKFDANVLSFEKPILRSMVGAKLPAELVNLVFKEIHGDEDGLSLTFTQNFKESTAQGAGLEIYKVLVDKKLPMPAKLQQTISIPNKFEHKVKEEIEARVLDYERLAIFRRTTSQAIQLAEIKIPSEIFWRHYFNKTYNKFSSKINNVGGISSEDSAALTFCDQQLDLTKHLAIDLLYARLKRLPHKLHREIKWALVSFGNQLDELSQVESIENVLSRLWDYWSIPGEASTTLGFIGFRALKSEALQFPEFKDEADMIVAAFIEAAQENVARKNEIKAAEVCTELRLRVFNRDLFGNSFSQKKIDSNSELVPFEPIKDFFCHSKAHTNFQSPLRYDLIIEKWSQLRRNYSGSEEFLCRYGFGQRQTRLSGTEFNDIRRFQSGDSEKHINARASLRTTHTMVNVYQSSEAISYAAFVNLDWLAEGTDVLGLGDNFLNLINFLRAAHSDQMSTEIHFCLDDRVIESITAKDMISAFSYPDSILNFIDQVLLHCLRFKEYEQQFGKICQPICTFPRITLTGFQHPVFFSHSSNASFASLSSLYGRANGCTLVSPAINNFTEEATPS